MVEYPNQSTPNPSISRTTSTMRIRGMSFMALSKSDDRVEVNIGFFCNETAPIFEINDSGICFDVATECEEVFLYQCNAGKLNSDVLRRACVGKNVQCDALWLLCNNLSKEHGRQHICNAG